MYNFQTLSQLYTQSDLYLRVEKVCVHHCAFNIIQVSVMLQCPLQEASFLTQLCHMSTIIVGEHLVTQDGICNL